MSPSEGGMGLVLQVLGRCHRMRLSRWKWVVWGHERKLDFSVSLPGLFLKRGSSRRETSPSSADTSRPWGSSHKDVVRWTMVASPLVRGRDGFKKISSHHLKSSTEGGGRFQGVGAADAAMVVVVPNRLLWSKRVWSLRIPP